MKTWRETQAVFANASRLLSSGEAVALATLVRIEGHCCRRVGSRLLIHRDGSISGPRTGGCLEADLRERAVRMLQSGAPPELIEYETGPQDKLWGLGMEPNGRVDVFLQRLEPPLDPVFEEINQRFTGIESFAIRTVLDGLDAGQIFVGPPFTDERSGIVLDDGDRIFVHHVDSPPHLVVVGAGEDAIPLVRIGADVGFRVTVVDHRDETLSPANFPAARALVHARPDAPLPDDIPRNVQTYAILMYHDAAMNEAWCQAFARTATPYIGVVRRGSKRAPWIDRLPKDIRVRVREPAGLPIGAEGPEQVAISILVEFLALESGQLSALLRDPAAAI
ncbi:MAG: XdhC family protein [Kiritimatiellae bacterium]|nr:XdhC family protein [Kiritimatiellia bacterium]MDW8457863.1 XdhC family protein [Verrucomicrobiota bacterium]